MDLSKFNIPVDELPEGKELSDEEYESDRMIEFLEKLLKMEERNAHKNEIDRLVREYGWLTQTQVNLYLTISDDLAEAEDRISDLQQALDWAEYEHKNDKTANELIKARIDIHAEMDPLIKQAESLRGHLKIIKDNRTYRLYCKSIDKEIPKRSHKEIMDSLYGGDSELAYNGETGEISPWAQVRVQHDTKTISNIKNKRRGKKYE